MNKFTYVGIAIAIVVVALIATGADRKLFGGSSTVEMIQQKASAFSSQMKGSRSKLASFVNEKSDGRFALEDPALAVVAENVSGDSMTSLLVTGIMRTSEGVSMALVNGSLVCKGDSVRGCEVLDVTQKGVSFEIAGESVFVAVHDEYSFKKVQSGGMTLEKVESRDGQNFAVINGRSFQAGDWVDGDTRVKAVTPTMVLFDVAGSRVMLKVGESH